MQGCHKATWISQTWLKKWHLSWINYNCLHLFSGQIQRWSRSESSLSVPIFVPKNGQNRPNVNYSDEPCLYWPNRANLTKPVGKNLTKNAWIWPRDSPFTNLEHNSLTTYAMLWIYHNIAMWFHHRTLRSWRYAFS
jgi:hypothetical protein